MFQGVGPQTARKAFSSLGKIDIMGLCNYIEGKAKVAKKAKVAIKSVADILEQITEVSLNEACRIIVEDIYLDYLLKTFDDASSRQEDIVFLMDFLRGYDDLESLFSDIGITENFKREVSANVDTLILSTVHQAKGLEWDVVFVVGVVDGQFPHSKSLRSDVAIEEERRLFYVAMTRAKKYLILSSPSMGFDYGAGAYMERQSCFIDELPGDGYQEFAIEAKTSRRFY